MQISQSCSFGGLGEDQNISLATERWKINNRWKTPLAVRQIAKLVTAIKTFLNIDLSLKTQIVGELVHYSAEMAKEKWTRPPINQ